MNTSSISNINSSVNSFEVCCGYRQKYEELYKELSKLRIQYRTVKNQVIALRGSHHGQEEENTVLREFLAGKKELIHRLNLQIQQGEEEINRLEDALHEEEEQKREISQKITVIQKELKEKDAILVEVKQERDILNCKNQGLVREVGRLTEDVKSKIDEKEKDMEFMVKKMENFIEKTVKQLQTEVVQGVTIKSGPQSIEQRMSGSCDLGWMEGQVSKLVDRCKQLESTSSRSVEQKERENIELKVKVEQLQMQLRESMQLFQQNISQTNILKKRLNSAEQERQQCLIKTKVSSETRQTLNSLVIQKMIALLETHLPDSHNILDKLLHLLEGGVKRFEIQILMHQLSALSDQCYSKGTKNAVQVQQLQSLGRDYAQLQERYELLGLKYSTLEREYRQILEDNTRLIKFNGLSQYRRNRNASLLSGTVHIDSPQKRQKLCEFKTRASRGKENCLKLSNF